MLILVVGKQKRKCSMWNVCVIEWIIANSKVGLHQAVASEGSISNRMIVTCTSESYCVFFRQHKVKIYFVKSWASQIFSLHFFKPSLEHPLEGLRWVLGSTAGKDSWLEKEMETWSELGRQRRKKRKRTIWAPFSTLWWMISLSAARGMLGKWVIVMSRELCGYGLIMQCAKTGGSTTGCLDHSASAEGMCLCVLSGWLYHLLLRCLNLALLQWHLTCLKGQLTQSSNWTSVSFTSNIIFFFWSLFLHFLHIIYCVVSTLTGCS